MDERDRMAEAMLGFFEAMLRIQFEESEALRRELEWLNGPGPHATYSQVNHGIPV